MEYFRLGANKYGSVVVVTTGSGSLYLIGGLSRTGSGLVAVRTPNHSSIGGMYVVNHCPKHHATPPALQVGTSMCLGQQGVQPDDRAVHTTAIASIRHIEGAHVEMSGQAPQFTLPDGHELAPLAGNAPARR